MCLAPILIDNPNYHAYHLSNFIVDTESQKIAVPCGRCPVCVQLRQQYLVQRVQMESLDNFVFFGTLSYNQETLPSITVGDFNIKYADVRHFQDLVRYVRKYEDLPSFRYLACSEFGGKRHRPHWHFLLFIPHSSFGKPLEQINISEVRSLEAKLHRIFLYHWRHNEGSRKSPIWVNNCTYTVRGIKRNYDLHFVDSISSAPEDVSFYVSKYMAKFSDYVDRLKSALYFNTDPSEFKEIWLKVKPRFLYSKFFGNPHSDRVYDHITRGVKLGIECTDYPYPCFFSTTNGKSFPLSPYYRKKFLTSDQEMVFRERCLKLSPTDVLGDKEDDPFADVIERKFRRFEYTKHLISARDQDLGLLFDEVDYNLNDLLNSDVRFNTKTCFTSEEFAQDWQSFDVFSDCHLDFDDDLPD